jgi:hypothetical protein
LDKIQQDIEHFLADRDWYYDRRKNYFKNQGKPAERIISIPYLAAAVRAVALRDPASSQRQRSRSLRDDNVYDQVFNPRWDLLVYLASLEITRGVENVLHRRRLLTTAPPIALVHYVAFVYACSKLNRWNYRPDEVAAISGQPPGQSDVLAIRDALGEASRSHAGTGRSYQGVRLNRELIEKFVRKHYGGSEGAGDAER